RRRLRYRRAAVDRGGRRVGRILESPRVTRVTRRVLSRIDGKTRGREHLRCKLRSARRPRDVECAAILRLQHSHAQRADALPTLVVIGTNPDLTDLVQT